MIVTVTPNPALDLTWHVDAFTPGRSHRVARGRERAGGKGLNVARVAHAEGHAVTAIATAGGEPGERFARELAASGLPHALVPVAAATRQSVAIVDGRGEASVLNERGTALAPAEWAALAERVAEAARAAHVVVVSGSLPPGTPDSFLPGVVERAGTVPVVIDTSGPALLQAARAGARALKPNLEELRSATGRADPVDGARALLGLGAGLVVVSLGEDGLLALSAAEPGRATTARLEAPFTGNPTGAGDAAVAAIAVALSAPGPFDLPAMLRRAVAWSAAAVLMPLAGEISPRHPDIAAEVRIASVPLGPSTEEPG